MHQVELGIGGSHLAVGVGVGQDGVAIGEAIGVEEALSEFGVGGGASAAGAQVVVVGEGDAAQGGPASAGQVDVGMEALFAVGAGEAGVEIDFGLRAVGSVMEFGVFGAEMHHPAEGVAAVHEGAGSEEDFRLLEHAGVHGDGVLQVAFPIDGVVEAHPVQHQQDAVGFEAPNDGAAPAHLALLHEDPSVCRQGIGAGLGVGQGQFFGTNGFQAIGHHGGPVVAAAHYQDLFNRAGQFTQQNAALPGADFSRGERQNLIAQIGKVPGGFPGKQRQFGTPLPVGTEHQPFPFFGEDVHPFQGLPLGIEHDHLQTAALIAGRLPERPGRR